MASPTRFIRSVLSQNFMESKRHFAAAMEQKMRQVLAKEYRQVAETYIQNQPKPGETQPVGNKKVITTNGKSIVACAYCDAPLYDGGNSESSARRTAAMTSAKPCPRCGRV